MNQKVRTKVDSISTIKLGIPFTYRDSFGKNHTLTIVSEKDSDISQNKISISSALAKAILGKTAGSKTEVEAPGGKYEIRILETLNHYG